MTSQSNMNNINIKELLQDYMFTADNICKYTKHMIHSFDNSFKPKSCLKNIEEFKKPTLTNNPQPPTNKPQPLTNKSPTLTNKFLHPTNKPKMYVPKKQKDTLFWCFYILKNGLSNYEEIEINNQFFTIEKTEKFKYIDLIRQNKQLLKIHKIKPITELEDDLAYKEKISILTFFALCAIENINVMLISNRKVYQLLTTDIETNHIVHRNNKTFQHSIELDVTKDTINKYKETYYMMDSFDSTLKGIGSYKLDELLELCKKLNINVELETNKKITKKYVYELLVLNY